MLKIASIISEKFIIIIGNKQYVSYSYLGFRNHFETSLSMYYLVEKNVFFQQKIFMFSKTPYLNIYDTQNKKKLFFCPCITPGKKNKGYH